MSDDLKFKFTQTSRTFGDETALYDVQPNRRCTLGEVVEHVLKKKGEWGYLVIRGLGRKEYRHGELLDRNFAENILDTEVEKITGHGGWSRMDYTIELASMGDKKISDMKVVDYVTFQRMKAHLPKKAVLPSPKAQQAVADFCIDSGVVEAVADAFGYLNGIPMEDFSEAPAKIQDRICIAKDELRKVAEMLGVRLNDYEIKG